LIVGGRKQEAYQPVRFEASKPVRFEASKPKRFEASKHSSAFNKSQPDHGDHAVVLASFGSAPSDRRIPISITALDPPYDPYHPRKSSDPVMRPNNGYNNHSEPRHNHPPKLSIRPSRRERSCYVSDPGFGRNEQEQDDFTEKGATGGEPRSPPPPTFHNITDFEKRYGPCLPVNLSTNRKRFKQRPYEPSCTSPTRPDSSPDRPTPRGVAGTPAATVNRSGASPTRSKGLTMFFNQRDKHVDSVEDNSLSLEEGSLYADFIDHKTIEKKLFPSDLLKCKVILL